MRIIMGCLLALALMQPAPAEAGLGTLIKWVLGKGGDVAKTVTKPQARGLSGAAAAAGSALTITSLVTAAGLTMPPSDAEAAKVEEEIRVAVERGDTVYRARTCLNPDTEEFYVVPDWAVACPHDGEPPREGMAIELTGAQE